MTSTDSESAQNPTVEISFPSPNHNSSFQRVPAIRPNPRIFQDQRGAVEGEISKAKYDYQGAEVSLSEAKKGIRDAESFVGAVKEILGD